MSLYTRRVWPRLTTDSFKVFDYERTQRRTYYHPAGGSSAQTTSQSTGATAVSVEPSKNVVSAGGGTAVPATSPSLAQGLPSRPATPSDRTGVISRTGMDVEAQILNGGGMANMGGRGGWHDSELDSVAGGGLGSARNAPIELVRGETAGEQSPRQGSSPVRRPTPLRASST